ncbi:MAG: hypothetical protein ACHQ2Z_00045 [Elusimicrobiota bacterium]
MNSRAAAEAEIPDDFISELHVRGGAWARWRFDYRRLSAAASFSVFLSKDGDYYVQHANAADMPRVRVVLESLWDSIVSPEQEPHRRVRLLAEFEWLWYRAAPFGGAGAAIGDDLSLLLQERLEADGLRLRAHDRSAGHDLQALSLPIGAYVERRALELFD